MPELMKENPSLEQHGERLGALCDLKMTAHRRSHKSRPMPMQIGMPHRVRIQSNGARRG